MFEMESIPFAPALIESMRSLGYSFESAIADLIDNSVSAGAKRIDIFVETESNQNIIILDDGHGMKNEKLQEAMRYGSSNPLEQRQKDDLGRFGLGLKSASLSQCRKLIVVSKVGKDVSGYSWDLDHVISKGKWVLIGYSGTEIEKLPNISFLLKKSRGTYVYLEKFDRIETSTENLERTLLELVDNTREHISLVFHRFMNDGLKIYINDKRIKEKDPFLVNNKKTQLRREQTFNIKGEIISVKPYILPHISHLTKRDIEKVGSKERLRTEQGFYIYRNKRLIIWGTWFRLETKSELSKLARIKVDIPNTLDYMWNIDIKKSSASLPDIIKKNLYNAISESVYNSENVHNYRGRRDNIDNHFEFIWNRIKNRDGFEYQINRSIPQISILEETLNAKQQRLFNTLIQTLEENFPIATLYLDVSKGNIITEEDNDNENKFYYEILENIEFAKINNMDYIDLLKKILSVEPYCKIESLKKRCYKEFNLGDIE
ncbi:MAG: ATP-binding protein [Sarcina sp.]